MKTVNEMELSWKVVGLASYSRLNFILEEYKCWLRAKSKLLFIYYLLFFWPFMWSGSLIKHVKDQILKLKKILLDNATDKYNK